MAVQSATQAFLSNTFFFFLPSTTFSYVLLRNACVALWTAIRWFLLRRGSLNDRRALRPSLHSLGKAGTIRGSSGANGGKVTPLRRFGPAATRR